MEPRRPPKRRPVSRVGHPEQDEDVEEGERPEERLGRESRVWTIPVR